MTSYLHIMATSSQHEKGAYSSRPTREQHRTAGAESRRSTIALCDVYAFPGKRLSRRGCFDVSTLDWKCGCRDNRYFEGRKVRACFCDTDLCNAATMTSSLGHVIVMAAALFVTARLM